MITEIAVSKRLAEFVATATIEQLDEKALTYSRYALLDAIGVSIAAANLGEGVDPFLKWVKAQESKPECNVFAQDFKASASLAAFANGAMAHALDFEDAHDQALVHPNAAVVPAALAMAQVLNSSGKELLTAITVGCEVVCRLGLALTVKLDDFSWYPPPILSAYGATAAVAHLLKLNTEQTINAFSLTLLQATCSAEIKFNPRSHIRAIRDAFPSQTGVVSAQLAQMGIQGFEQPFEGKAGFFAEFARNQYEPNKIVDGLGKTFEIANLSFKRWPSCRGTHTAIELVLQQVKDKNLSEESIESITVFGSSINRMLAEPIESKQNPKTAIDAKFSIPFCVACAVVKGDVELDSFSKKGLKDNNVLSMAARINYIAEENITSMLSSKVDIKTKTGELFSSKSDDAYGCPERPLTERDLVNKFCACLEYSPRIEHKVNAGEFSDLVLHLDEKVSLEQLFNFL